MKDVVIIGLALSQRVLRDFRTDRPLVLLCGACNAVSAALVYWIISGWWGIPAAVLVAGVYLTGFWPWQIALFGGHICVAQVPFLACLAFLQASSEFSAVGAVLFTFAAGVAFGWLQFSSASARKFLVPVGAVILVVAWPPLVLSALQLALVCAVLLAVAALTVFALAFLRSAEASSETGATPVWVTRCARGSSEAVDIRRTFRAFRAAAFAVPLVLGGAVVTGVVFGARFLLLTVLPFIAGLVPAVLLLLLPDVRDNLRGYFSYWGIAATFGHFRLYRESFAQRGIHIAEDMRGEGWLWVRRIFVLMAPVQSALVVLSLLGLAVLMLTGRGQILLWVAIAVISASPVVFGEITKGPQLSRSYFPGFVTHGAVVAIAVERFVDLVSPTAVWAAVSVAIAISAASGAMTFFRDVLPARMAPAYLARFIRERGIQRVYTYDTQFNDALVKVLPAEALEHLEVRLVRSIADVTEAGAWFVVPGTSSKALNLESTPLGPLGADYDADPVLNDLFQDRRIEHVAEAAFATLGTSRIWSHESEVTSYRDLILHEITDQDRWRSHAWVLRLPLRESEASS